ncbi:type VI secretion system protein ImpN [Rhizobium sp. NFR07]|uniref:serine/threonine-protein kinase n=1 Tax=Rhizobium sp. NFR07 TaxID=1566262 RepID=UPI0008E90024|nr:serine/threonine-protein kinase [Rhizobium sp. NFR07]SFB15068.1 type VI secretion system protein ImpN [Rhizobium sp. NFR07]
MADEPKPAVPAGMATIADSFATLWRSLAKDGEADRPNDERRILIDQVRDALDRGENRLNENRVSIISNTFSLEALVHRGEPTSVHRARHRDLGALHAIKTLSPDHADDPVAHKLLLQEATIGLSLRHPHVAATQILLRLEDGRPALVMEWCRSSLADRLSNGPLPPEDIRALAKALLEGLSAIHARSIVHCDISPANILFADDTMDSLKIADFGIALPTGHRHKDMDIRFAGQAHFAAPEQKDGGPVDPRTDLHAAGKVLSLLLEGSDDPADADLRRLADLLSQPASEDRPENAKAALRMLGGL